MSRIHSTDTVSTIDGFVNPFRRFSFEGVARRFAPFVGYSLVVFGYFAAVADLGYIA